MIRQSNDSPRELADNAVIVVGLLILAEIVFGMAHFALVLRRVDELEASRGP